MTEQSASVSTESIHENTEMSASEAIIEQLRAEDIDLVFGMIGSAFADIMDLFPPAEIDFVGTRHEQYAVHMADGYAQALRGQKAAVVTAQNGPGVTNMVTGLKTAQLNHMPIVLLSPTVSNTSIGTDAIQEADTMSIMSDCVEWQGRLENSRRAAEYVRTAFKEAYAQHGPAQVDFSRNILPEVSKTDIRRPNQYRQANFGAADEDEIDKAVELIEQAETPGIISGYGVVQSDAVDSVEALAEMLNAPVANTFMHNDSFRASHPLAMGALGFQGSKSAPEALSDCDLILAIGTRLGAVNLRAAWDVDWFSSDQCVIQIDVNPSQISRPARIDLGLVGDAGKTTDRIVAALRDSDKSIGASQARREKVEKIKADWERELAEMSKSDQTPIHPRRALRDVTEALPENTMVTLDIGNVCSTARGYLKFENPGNLIAAGHFEGIGYAWPAALGAKIARPDDHAVAIMGDGAWSMNLPELLTALSENITATAFVFNNNQWGAEKQNQAWYYNERYIAADLENPDFVEVAEAMGGHGIRVEEPDEITPAVEEALETDGPSVLDIIIDPDEMVPPFRSDVLDEPQRTLPKYRQPGDPNY